MTALTLGMLLTLVNMFGDLSVAPSGTGLASLLILRSTVLGAGLGVAWIALSRPRPPLLAASFIGWQLALVVGHLVSSAFWPHALPAHVSAMSLMLFFYFIAPNSLWLSLLLTAAVTASHIVAAVATGATSTLGEIITAAIAIHAAGIMARMREQRYRSLLEAIEDGDEAAQALRRELDLTEERASADRARLIRERQSIMAAVPVPLLLVGSDGAVRLHNEAAAEFHDAHTEGSREKLPIRIGRLGPGGPFEQEVETPAGDRRLLLIHTRTIDLDGEEALLSALLDQTRVRALEAKVQGARRDADLSQGRSRLAEAELSHELRTPLNRLYGSLQLIETTVLTAEQADHFSRLREAAEVLLAILDDRTKLEPGAVPVAPIDVGLHILLVEDDDVSRLLTRTLLEREGHRLTVATTGPEAVNAAARGGFDLVLMDIRLPGFGGIAAARRIRALPDAAASGVPIVAMTANVLPSQLARYRAAGMLQVVPKPVELDRLRTVIAAAITRGGSSGPATADPQARVTSGAGKPARPSAPALRANRPPRATEKPPLDVSVLDGHRQVLGPARLVHVIDSFQLGAPKTMETIREARADHDVPALAKAAHKMGSGALTVGLGRLASLCRSVETLANSGNSDGALSQAAEMDEALEEGLTALDDYRLRLGVVESRP